MLLIVILLIALAFAPSIIVYILVKTGVIQALLKRRSKK